MTIQSRNTFPANQYDLLRRALNCNKSQLAAHLGVSSKTLRTWETEGGGANAAARVAQLWGIILRQSQTEWLEVSQVINFNAIQSIGGKR